jgi:hypothetical protein
LKITNTKYRFIRDLYIQNIPLATSKKRSIFTKRETQKINETPSTITIEKQEYIDVPSSDKKQIV